jgi:hypothetical protein
MGKPGGSHIPSSSAEYIGGRRPTERTETSKYLQEKKSIRDSLSSGERKGRSPNQAFGSGVVGPGWDLFRPGQHDSRSDLERSAIRGESPVGEIVAAWMIRVPEYGGTREIPSESGGTTLQGYILVRDR